MTTEPEKSKSTAQGYVSVAWPPFVRKLAEALGKLQEDQYLILNVKRSSRFIQFAAQGSFGMRVETTSNSFLAKDERLDQRQIAALMDAGWMAPTGTPEASTLEHDPDGSSNFFMEFPAPILCEAIANLTARTFAQILRIPHPGALEYEAFDEDSGVLAFPELGLRIAKRNPDGDKLADLPRQLLTALMESTGIDDLEFDDDGDVGIRYGSAIAFISLIDEPLRVRIYSKVLHDVDANADVVHRLNDINAREVLMRFVLINGSIFAIADVCATPFVGAHVAHVLAHFCSIADGMDSLLQAEFGGKTAFPESMPSSLRH